MASVYGQCKSVWNIFTELQANRALNCVKEDSNNIIEHHNYYFCTVKWYYDENHIFSIEAILWHKQVACMRRKMLFTIFKYLFLFQRYSSFKNMQISLVMTSYTQPSFDQIWWKKISRPIFMRNVSFFAVRFYLMCSKVWA